MRFSRPVSPGTSRVLFEEPAMQSADDVSPARAAHDPCGSLQIYMREIGRTPLLTIAEAIALAERIRRGDQAARDHMIRANLRLVVKIAMDYKECGLPLLDLISEGNIGLVKAVERFDPRKGGKLSTYAAWWIRQSVRRALATQGKTIRLPVHLVDKIAAMRRIALALTERLGREPADDELAAELQIPTSKVAHWKTVSARAASLDAQMGDDEGAWTFGEIVRDERAPNPYECLREKTSTRDLHEIIDSLEPREARIIRLRFWPRWRRGADARGGRPTIRDHARAYPPARSTRAQKTPARDGAPREAAHSGRDRAG